MVSLVLSVKGFSVIFTVSEQVQGDNVRFSGSLQVLNVSSKFSLSVHDSLGPSERFQCNSVLVQDSISVHDSQALSAGFHVSAQVSVSTIFIVSVQ